MPPHCDTMDGPVVKAAKMALETGNVKLILPWTPKKVEDELRRAFERTLRVRKTGKEAAELADYWFYETAVRLHRAGEGEPYTGLKPAGLDEGPVVPRAEKAIDRGNAKELTGFLSHVVEEELDKRLKRALSLKDYSEGDVDAAREYVEAELEFILYSHKLYTYMVSAGGHTVEVAEIAVEHKH